MDDERDPTAEYLALLRSSLAEWKPRLHSELIRILASQFHPEVDLLHFELFDDSICESAFPFYLYCQRKADGVKYYSTPLPTARQVFDVPADSAYFPGWYHLLDGDRRPIIDPDLWTAYGEETDFAFTEAESQIVHDWFLDCWREMDGPSIRISSFLLRLHADQHDEGFDLRGLAPVTWLGVWK